MLKKGVWSIQLPGVTVPREDFASHLLGFDLERLHLKDIKGSGALSQAGVQEASTGKVHLLCRANLSLKEAVVVE